MTDSHGSPAGRSVSGRTAMRRIADALDTGEEGQVRLRERDGQVWLSIRSEFAMVELQIRSGASGPRVLLRDVEADTSITLDPLELEALTRLDHESFGPLIVER